MLSESRRRLQPPPFGTRIFCERTRTSVNSTLMFLQGKHILVVEDNIMNLTVVKAFLQRWGAEVVHAGNGQECLDIAEHQTFDLVLMDIMMPVMDGLTATRALRERQVDTPILALTATVMENEAETILESGMNGFLLKPFRPDDLESKIRDYVSVA